MSKAVLYDVWTDGSYRNQKVGAGWIISHDGVEREGRNAIARLKDKDVAHGSDIAEIFAIQCALRDVPTGSKIALRVDAQNIIDWLNNKKIPLLDKKDVPTLKTLFEQVIELALCMDEFSLIKVTGKTNANLNRAHKLSQIASSPHRVTP